MNARNKLFHWTVPARHEAMLQKLAVIREARESLNDMRAQHQEKAKQQELEQEML